VLVLVVALAHGGHLTVTASLAAQCSWSRSLMAAT
jgi:hypothetical protein